MRRGNEKRRGLSIVEVSLTVTLLVVFAGGTLTLGRSLSRAFRSESSVAQRDATLHAALDRMATRLRSADGQGINPPSVLLPLHEDSITFQRVTGHDGTNPILGELERFQFEYEVSDPDDGRDNDGDGLIDEGRLVWTRDLGGPNERTTVLVSSVPETGSGEIPGNGIDDNGNGLDDEAGITFQVDQDRMRIVLSIESFDAEDTLQVATGERTVVMRNTGATLPTGTTLP